MAQKKKKISLKIAIQLQKKLEQKACENGLVVLKKMIHNKILTHFNLQRFSIWKWLLLRCYCSQKQAHNHTTLLPYL
jgi:hypothetical protein